MIASELACNRLGKCTADSHHGNMIQALKKAILPKSNITRDERVTLKALRKDDTIHPSQQAYCGHPKGRGQQEDKPSLQVLTPINS